MVFFIFTKKKKMILIADSGSTKCDWIALEKNTIQLKTSTLGLNPAVFELSTLEKRVNESVDLLKIADQVTALYFYGAGCSSPTPIAKLSQLLQQIFKNATIQVREDMYGAVYAVTANPAIICILGTGSNSCYFDGENIYNHTPSLGYMIMDEASGNAIGKQLLRDYFYKTMPETIASVFEKTYDLNPDTIKTKLYKQDNPNTYLAGFAHFAFSQDLTIPYFYNLVTRAFAEFVKIHILCYDNAKALPIHFIGSIAHYGRKILEEVLTKNDLTLGKVVKKPIDGLVDYHSK